MFTSILLLTVFVFSVVAHEVAHGWVARLNGDDTAEKEGRLSLNPLKHVDPVGTVLLPVLLYILKAGIIFGWAKPVPINPRKFKQRIRGLVAVGVAGPVANFLLAVLFALVYRLADPGSAFARLCVFGVTLNILLMVFNLLPIPPLDGSRVIAPILPKPLLYVYARLEKWGFVILLALAYTGDLQRWVYPLVGWIANSLLS